MCRDEAVRIVLDQLTDSATRQTMKSIADDLIEQGIARGLEQGREQGLELGREQGLERGRREGVAQTLLQLLAERFGPVPAEFAAAVAAADEATLRQWTLRTITAPTLGAVFAHG